MSGATWNGIYLKSSVGVVASSLLRLAKTRHFRVETHIPRVAPSDFGNISLSKFIGPGGKYEVIALLDLGFGWTRLIGLELVNTSYPRMFFTSELIERLGCDAFVCGYYDRQGWWYCYYEDGRIIDQFHSDPNAPMELYATDLYDPNDLRTTFLKCLRYSDDYTAPKSSTEVVFPSVVTDNYVGHPDLLAPIARNNNTTDITEILDERDVEVAVERMSRYLSLPYMGELRIAEIAQADPYHTSFSSILELIRLGLAVIVLEHPKVRLL
jgi:hypothetical protein